jgi:hypothetical protein
LDRAGLMLSVWHLPQHLGQAVSRRSLLALNGHI